MSRAILFARIRERVTPGGVDECWPWPGARTGGGYGAIGMRIDGKRHTFLVHRIVADALPGETVRHTCDNPPCCNPNHLLIGTMADNQQDMAHKGRAVVNNEAVWSTRRERYGRSGRKPKA